MASAGPGVHDHGQIGEARLDGDTGDVRNPELVGCMDLEVHGDVREYRAVVVAVGGGDEAAPALRLQAALAHDAADLLGVDDQPAVTELGSDAPVAVGRESLTDRLDLRDDCRLGGLCRRRGMRQEERAMPISSHPRSTETPSGR